MGRARVCISGGRSRGCAEEEDPQRGRDVRGENSLMPVMANEPIILNVYDMVSGSKGSEKCICDDFFATLSMYYGCVVYMSTAKPKLHHKKVIYIYI